ncbi:MAG: histidinol-phosphatase [Coxiella sp. (in: Bacteria)]|nr:MAG: histidinol-phosphatase [Coxiella sp. (in: g-proteobacteria)]
MMLDRELEIARKAAQAAADIHLKYQALDKHIEIKPDLSPVSIVDKICEDAIISMLHDAFPNDGFLGEETGATDGTSGRTWIIDPLDGTRPYLKGIPTYSVLIALVEGAQPIVGVMQLPGLNEVYYAAKGQGAFCNGNPIHVSNVSKLEDAYGSAYGHIKRMHDPLGKAVIAAMYHWDFAMGFMDAYTYGCIASGKLDVCLNLSDKPWDCAAAACIIKEAGGQYSDIDGNESIFNGSFVISNGHLHATLLTSLDG